MNRSSAFASVKRWIAGHPVAAFLIALYPLEWIIFIPALLGRSGFGIMPALDVSYQIPLLVLIVLGLVALPFLVTRIANGKAGTRELRRHYYRFRVGPQWYLAALFGPPLVLLAVGLMTRGGGVLGPIASNIAKAPTLLLVMLITNVLVVNVWEEGAWMAFMTSRLQKRIGPVWASLLVAPCFGFVHFPLFFVAYGLGPAHLTLSDVPFYAFVLLIGYSAPVRILVTWLFNSTGGSVPIVGLFHAAMDVTAAAATLAVFYPWTDGNLLYVGFAVIAVALVVVTRGRLGYRADQAPAPSPQPTPVAAALQ